MAYREVWQSLFMSGVMISILNDDKTIIGYAKVARDITRRKMLEEQKDEFIKIASHELKTPVTTVKAFTEILLERFEKVKIDKALRCYKQWMARLPG
ncbi:hypothetical protein LWM68_09480 [Niabella sp. W65]|nr:hypothetical protein [Niabella sp. W65]MCH7362978.1 hypothetical protein [Niabella sp. W65]ULT38916.1 hypothetical protein KRR40_28150 [Niabella sp. I65]